MKQEYKVYGSRWGVLIVFMYLVALTQLYWLNFAAIETFIEDYLKIPPSDAMWLTLVQPVFMILLTIPAGMIIDKIGLKWGVWIGALFTGLGAILRVFDPASFTVLLIGQTLIAIGQPFILNGSTKIATLWFAPREEGTAIGLASLAQFIGMMVALGLTPSIVEGAGFDAMIWIYGIAGLAGTVAFSLVPKQPRTLSRAPDQDQSAVRWGGIGTILKNRNFVLLGFIAFAGIGAFNGLALWVEKILNEMHGIAMTDAGAISGIMVISATIGCFIIPFISDKIGRRRIFIFIATLVAPACLTFMIFAPDFTANLINGILIGFLWLSALPIILTMSAEMTGAKYAGVAAGWLFLLGNIAALVLGAAVESLRGLTGNFVAALLMLAAVMLAAFFVALFMKDTHPQQ
ncbi:MAG: MFS transporter [Dehalococcoidia bacterium]|jgi:nitrate/nitrite transporter NarK